MCALSGYLVSVINNLNVLPSKFFIIFITSLVILNIGAAGLLFLKRLWGKILSGIIYGILIIISIIGITYGNETIRFLNKAFNNNKVEVTTYNILSLKSYGYRIVKDIENKKLGYLNTDHNLEECLRLVQEQVTTDNQEYEDLYELYDDLVAKNVEAIVLDSAYMEVLAEEYDTFFDDIITLYVFNIEDKKEIEEVKIKELEPLNIYISGSNSRSTTIYNKSRSDVNMILTINPKTRTILMTSIPRDYYVQVHGQTGLKDKITHAGIYGIDVSVATIEDLFNIDISYSIKIGMNAVVELVDLVGGIDVDSDREFDSYHMPGWRVQKGINHMDGAKALAYARERYAYRTGDRHRILNQQQVLEATMKKIMVDKNILLKYDELLTSLSKLYRTDIPRDVITLVVKNQLNDMRSWTFESMSVSGGDASLPTHTAPNSKRYVMIPYENDIKEATEKINQVLNGE